MSELHLTPEQIWRAWKAITEKPSRAIGPHLTNIELAGYVADVRVGEMRSEDDIEHHHKFCPECGRKIEDIFGEYSVLLNDHTPKDQMESVRDRILLNLTSDCN